MLNYIFDSHLASNKHHHHDRYAFSVTGNVLFVLLWPHFGILGGWPGTFCFIGEGGVRVSLLTADIELMELTLRHFGTTYSVSDIFH